MAKYEKILESPYSEEKALIKSNDWITFQQKKQKKLEIWEKQFLRGQAKLEKELAIQKAKEQTEEAESNLLTLNSILEHTLSVDDAINWSNLLKTDDFHEFEETTISALDVLWMTLLKHIPLFGLLVKKKQHAHQEKENQRKKDYLAEKKQFDTAKEEYNINLTRIKNKYEEGLEEGVKEYLDFVLERSEYPTFFNIYFDTFFNSEQSTAIADVNLPAIEDMPSIKSYKYIHTRKIIEPKPISKKTINTTYNSTIYQLTLRTIHEILESDYSQHVDIVVFNGWIETINKATGINERKCILTLQAFRDEFMAINLEKVDPEECFKHLKGVTAGDLSNLSPVRPLMKINREDNRIVSADPIIDTLDSSKNLATMDWQDFEVLIRDLISKEFANEGSQVEVTQASRDQGVDALAFDEDPIRGGKYVIQAKRYNNLVGVNAVRDLYGTVINEGAVKGILITTSSYGKESLEFAKDKPLTLINGQELLYLFGKHNYNFRIELTK